MKQNKVVCITAVGNSDTDPKRLKVAEQFQLLEQGWLNPIWWDHIQKYGIDINCDVWLHNPRGAEVPMRFDQSMQARLAGFGNTIGNDKEYEEFANRLWEKCTLLYSYIGSVQNTPEPGMGIVPYRFLRDWMMKEVRPFVGTGRRLCLDAAYRGWEDNEVYRTPPEGPITNEASWQFANEIKQKYRDPVVEAIASRSEKRWYGFDTCLLYRLLSTRHMIPEVNKGRWPLITDEDFPKGQVFVIFRRGDHSVQQIRDGWEKIKTEAPHVDWVAAPQWPVIERDPGVVDFFRQG